jgi:hypothetical protein
MRFLVGRLDRGSVMESELHPFDWFYHNFFRRPVSGDAWPPNLALWTSRKADLLKET